MNWAIGKNYPDASIICQLAEILDVTVSEILNGELKHENNNINVKKKVRKLPIKIELLKENRKDNNINGKIIKEKDCIGFYINNTSISKNKWCLKITFNK